MINKKENFVHLVRVVSIVLILKLFTIIPITSAFCIPGCKDLNACLHTPAIIKPLKSLISTNGNLSFSSEHFASEINVGIIFGAVVANRCS